MTKTEALIKQFSAAIKRLDEVLRHKKNEYIRDSAIQRFEFTFDLAWKTIKAHLADYGVQCNSPKECFRSAYQQQLIDYDNFWIEMTNLRNLTSHTYIEALAEKVYKTLPACLENFQKLLKKLKEKV